MVDSFFDALPEYLELVMGYAPALFMVAIPLAVFIAYRKTQAETNQAIETARLLGLRYSNVAKEMQARQPGDSLLLGLLSRWSPWAMDGTYNRIPVRVELIVKGRAQRYLPKSGSVSISNPTRTSYSRGIAYTASFQKPLPFQINIRPKIQARMPFGISQALAEESIGTGDQELDQMLMISGNDRDGIREWLDSGQRKETLKRLYQVLPAVTMNSGDLRFYDQNKKADYKHLQNNLTLLSKAAQKLMLD